VKFKTEPDTELGFCRYEISLKGRGLWSRATGGLAERYLREKEGG